MSLFLYNIFLFLYGTALKLAAFWNPKAKSWVTGRRAWEASLSSAMNAQSSPVLWMHCASLGEFEQGRPVLELIREKYPAYTILITFFSPSGYEIRKNYQGADYVCYLPLDGSSTARRFLDIVKPDIVLWVRYEFWYHFLNQLFKRGTPVILISGLFHSSQPFFQWFGRLHRHMLSCFRYIFVQNAESASLLRNVGIENVAISGDTRYDRVSAIAEAFVPLPEIAAFVNGLPVVVGGSTWPEDEEELDHFANTNSGLRFIIAPHEIGEHHLKDIEKLFHNTVRYSKWVEIWKESAFREKSPHVLIIDNIGMLSRLYHYATIAYVGGGFGGDGLHNILEAAVYGRPVIHGPHYERFPEAIELIEAGGSFWVENALELEDTLKKLLANSSEYGMAAVAAEEFVRKRRGATHIIIDYLEVNRLLTN
ncbi:3-deoxy-D-manno-octulosonic acid transferase [Flavihumibacter sediminis]|nr:3-deoxy-D-manno-octulosonic acid transferase [Flavihumibacter sediminis]